MATPPPTRMGETTASLAGHTGALLAERLLSASGYLSPRFATGVTLTVICLDRGDDLLQGLKASVVFESGNPIKFLQATGGSIRIVGFQLHGAVSSQLVWAIRFFFALRTRTWAPLCPGTLPLISMSFCRVNFYHQQVLHGTTLVPHLPRHDLALEYPAGVLAQTDGSHPPVEHGTVGGRSTLGIPAFDHTLESASFGHTDYVDFAALGKTRYGQGIAHPVSRIPLTPDFLELGKPGQRRFFSGGPSGGAHVFGLFPHVTDLQGVEPVVGFGFDLGDGTGPGFDNGDRDQTIFIVKDLGHSDFFSYKGV